MRGFFGGSGRHSYRSSSYFSRYTYGGRHRHAGSVFGIRTGRSVAMLWGR